MYRIKEVQFLLSRRLDNIRTLFPFEYHFGVLTSVESNFPTWARIFRNRSTIDFASLPLSCFYYVNEINTSYDGEWSSLGAVQINYTFRFDFLFPLSTQNDSEDIFWERIERILSEWNQSPYRLLEDTIYLTPLNLSLGSEPYTELLGMVCHYAQALCTVIDSQPYGKG
jgi:hypothetical protein